MDFTIYQQWFPSSKESSRGLGLFLNTVEMVKAVPIIGESKESKPTPSLVSPSGASISSKPAIKVSDTRTSSAPKVLDSSGKQTFSSSPTPSSSPFEGKTVTPKASSGFSEAFSRKEGASKPSGGGIITSPYESKPYNPIVNPSGKEVSSNITAGPGAAKPNPKLFLAGDKKPAPLVDKFDPSPNPVVDRFGKEVAPRHKEQKTETIISGADTGRGNAKKFADKQTPSQVPENPALDHMRSKEGRQAAAKRGQMKKENANWDSVISQAHKREAASAEARGNKEAYSGAVSPQQQKMLESGGIKKPKGFEATKPGQDPKSKADRLGRENVMRDMRGAGPKGGKDSKGSSDGRGSQGDIAGRGSQGDIAGRNGAAPGRSGGAKGARRRKEGPNPLGWATTGYNIGMSSDPSATVSNLGLRGIAYAQKVTNKPGRYESARMDREAHLQRQELTRMQNKQASLDAPSAEHPPVRSGLRRP